MDIRKVVDCCEASSPERPIPVEIRNRPPRDVTEKVINRPLPLALLLALKRGGTFNVQ